MKNIQYRFRAQQEKRPMHSTFLNFAAAIKGQGFTAVMVRRWFNKLVDPDDYAPEEKREHLQYFYELAKRAPGRPHSRGNLAQEAPNDAV
jgi:hypothetical protein